MKFVGHGPTLNVFGVSPFAVLFGTHFKITELPGPLATTAPTQHVEIEYFSPAGVVWEYL
jgi:hypothetical protein